VQGLYKPRLRISTNQCVWSHGMQNSRCNFFSKFSCHGNTLLTVFSISEFSDTKHILWTQIPNVFCIGPKLWPNYCNFGLFLPKFGCHGNVICSLKNPDSIFEFANRENTIVRAKNISLHCVELNMCSFHIFLSKFGCHGNAVCFIENSDSLL